MKADRFGATGKGRRRPGEMNKTEAAYFEHLKSRDDIVQIQFESVKFRLAHNCHYTPDFMVMTSDCSIEFHEIKGSAAIFQDDAKVKIKVAAQKFPFKFVVVMPKKGGQWSVDEVK